MVADMTPFLKYGFLLLLCCTWVAADYEKGRLELEKQIMKDIFMVSKFHMLIRPPKSNNVTHDDPVDVDITAYVLNVDVNTAKQEVTVQLYFRQEWNDSRLAYDNKGKVEFLSTHDVTGFWTPDLFFVNEKDGHFHTLTKPNSFIRIYPNGNMLYSQRLSLTISCPMELSTFPFDSQVCPLIVESYGYTMKDIFLRWKANADRTPLGVTETSGYGISYKISSELITTLGDNRYSRVELEVYLTRHTFQYVFHIYVPLFLLVVLSWISFWLNPSSIVPRFAITTTTTVCTLLQLYSNSHLFPTVCALTALDVWVAVSCVCVIGALFENIYVSSVQRSDLDVESGLLNGVKVQDGKKTEDTQLTMLKLVLNKLSRRIPTIDTTARIIFPLLYVLFNVAYFTRLALYSSASYV